MAICISHAHNYFSSGKVAKSHTNKINVLFRECGVFGFKFCNYVVKGDIGVDF